MRSIADMEADSGSVIAGVETNLAVGDGAGKNPAA
jgi:hypothetical protein